MSPGSRPVPRAAPAPRTFEPGRLGSLALALALCFLPALNAQPGEGPGGPGVDGPRGGRGGPAAPADPGAPTPPPGAPGGNPGPGPADPGGPGNPGNPNPGNPGSPQTPGPQPPGAQPTGPAVCPGGVAALSAGEVERLLLASATAVDAPYTIAVVDRAGRVLGLLRKDPLDASQDDRAVGLARTGAFFSNDQAPLSSRTVRFVSGVHFPPGVARTPNAALYGIENTNRGCDLNVTFEPGKDLPPARSVAAELSGGPCNAFDASGCGTGPVTGKPGVYDTHVPPGPGGGAPVHNPAAVPVDPGGLPVFRGGHLVGGIGVAGLPTSQSEFAALVALLSPNASPSNPPAANPDGLSVTPIPLPAPKRVYIDGIQLPLVLQTRRPRGTAAGAAAGSFEIAPRGGGCAPEGYLVGPRASASLSAAEVDRIVRQSIDAARRTRAVIRLPSGSRARMVIAVGDERGEILALYRMADATVFSVDVAVAKARNVAYFSSPTLAPGAGLGSGVPPGTAVTNRTISFGAQPLYPVGIDGTRPGPFFDLFLGDTARPCSQGDQPANANQNGIVFFPGSIPLYRTGAGGAPLLVGGLGISGDGVEQDDYVSYLGAEGFLPPEDIRADRLFVRDVRLPFLKFPRNPER